MNTSTLTMPRASAASAKPRRGRRFTAAALTIASVLAGGLAASTDAAGAVEGSAHSARAASAANFVRVNQALLRSQPNTRSTKLDVANAGNGVDLYCWVESEGGGGPIWFRAHFWGGRYTGWIRSDLVSWNSYPSPYHC